MNLGGQFCRRWWSPKDGTHLQGVDDYEAGEMSPRATAGGRFPPSPLVNQKKLKTWNTRSNVSFEILEGTANSKKNPTAFRKWPNRDFWKLLPPALHAHFFNHFLHLDWPKPRRLPLLKRLADFQMSAVAKALMTSSNWKAGSLVEIPPTNTRWLGVW